MSTPDKPKVGDIVEFIADIFNLRGADSYLGEAVTMSEHMLQAALLAETSGAADELVAAALLHDIGHYTNEFPEDALEQGINNFHDQAGAALLAPYFPPLVIECTRWHVQAKRYLCAVEPGYADQLSAASVHTLNLQGGPMNALEARDFARRLHLQDILSVRRFDEQAKIAGVATPSFDHYAPLLRRLVKTSV